MECRIVALWMISSLVFSVFSVINKADYYKQFLIFIILEDLHIYCLSPAPPRSILLPYTPNLVSFKTNKQKEQNQFVLPKCIDPRKSLLSLPEATLSESTVSPPLSSSQSPGVPGLGVGFCV